MKHYRYIEVLIEHDAAGGVIFPSPNSLPGESGLTEDYYEFAKVCRQVHSCDVVEVTEDFQGHPEGDALVTFLPDVTIGVVTADCVPILLYAPDVKGVAAVHAGWKGTFGGVLEKTLDLLVKRGADVKQLKAAFGPSISKENYEVSPELAERFAQVGFADFISYPGGPGSRPHLDLQGINVRRLRQHGVLLENIKESKLCSYGAKTLDGKRALLPSYRRTGGLPTRMLTCIRLVGNGK